MEQKKFQKREENVYRKMLSTKRRKKNFQLKLRLAIVFLFSRFSFFFFSLPFSSSFPFLSLSLLHYRNIKFTQPLYSGSYDNCNSCFTTTTIFPTLKEFLSLYKSQNFLLFLGIVWRKFLILNICLIFSWIILRKFSSFTNILTILGYCHFGKNLVF